jgi:predicted MFS family arabinose efflux permease
MTTDSAHPQTLNSRTAVIVFVSFVFGYFLSYALRSVNATIAPLLAQDLGLSAAELGWLSSAYFLSFAGMQWLVGSWLDKHGARRTESALLATAAVGALIVAVSGSLWGLSIGRILIGAGVSACLMAPYAYFRRCFAPDRQAQLAMWMLIGGTSGALASTQPTLLLAEAIGWRHVFLITSGLLALAAFAIFKNVPDIDITQIKAQSRTNKKGVLNASSSPPKMNLLAVLSHPNMLRVIPTTLTMSGGFIALQSLWVGPWMTDVLGMTTNETGMKLFYFNLALIFAYVIMSVVSPKLIRSGYNLSFQSKIGFFWILASMIGILAWRDQHAWWLWVVMAGGVPAIILMQTQTGMLFPPAVAGRVLTTFNLIMFVGAFVMQWGIGLAVDLFMFYGQSRDQSLWLSLLVLLCLQVISVIWFLRKPEPIPQA